MAVGVLGTFVYKGSYLCVFSVLYCWLPVSIHSAACLVQLKHAKKI